MATKAFLTCGLIRIVERVFRGQPVRIKDSREGEYATAVLAAAFAIQSVEESKTLQNKNGLQPHSNGVTRQPSYNNAKVPWRKPKLQDRGALETLNPPRTPSRSSSDAREKNEKHEKLKSVVAWANEKKEKAKNKIEKTKSDLDLKFSKKPATWAKGGPIIYGGEIDFTSELANQMQNHLFMNDTYSWHQILAFAG
ncbi:hypothetical protein Patl1_18828 [Pistacia atlantica]|uniref:Uncharacterized protein n=1 Tax=Pistacia atlantica TaxID=434234 RepID=A0ACC1C1J4_9ROSI|nr:hypothetical protein Patl1_18828 [Pistacia atlantica]